MTTKILLADDHGIIREGLRLLLDQQKDMEVIGEASNGMEAVELVKKLKPDVIVMDVSMPQLNGINAAKEIIDENPKIRILALSAHANKTFITDMLRAGVSGYILKDGMADELINAVRTIRDNQQYLSPKAATIVISEYISKNNAEHGTSLLSKLTDKERKLIQLLSENMSNKQAARLLHVSVKTIDARRRTIMEKLAITGIADLTKFAIREGITTVDF